MFISEETSFCGVWPIFHVFDLLSDGRRRFVEHVTHSRDGQVLHSGNSQTPRLRGSLWRLVLAEMHEFQMH